MYDIRYFLRINFKKKNDLVCIENKIIGLNFLKKNVSNSKNLVSRSYLHNKHETKRKNYGLPSTRH